MYQFIVNLFIILPYNIGQSLAIESNYNLYPATMLIYATYPVRGFVLSMHLIPQVEPRCLRINMVRYITSTNTEIQPQQDSNTVL